MRSEDRRVVSGGGAINGTAMDQRRPERVGEARIDGGRLLYWESSEAAKLFGFEPGDDAYDGVKKKDNLLTDVLNLADGYKSIVDGEADSLSGQHIFNLHTTKHYTSNALTVLH